MQAFLEEQFLECLNKYKKFDIQKHELNMLKIDITKKLFLNCLIT